MKDITVVTGPTASGKSAKALELAEKLNGEIISADSMQLYKALPIGTAQPTEAEKAAVPHHLVGILELSERADVFAFCKMADEAIRDIRSRGRHPIICGGTGLYIRALICGMDDLPADRGIRRELDEKFDRDDAADELAEYAAEIDPAALEKWKDCRRKLIRALEVKLISGRSIFDLQQGFEKKRRFDAEVILFDLPAEILKEKIRRRTDIMLASGWIEEAENAIADGLFTSPTAHQALGYKQIAAFLDGSCSKAELPAAIATATWQYARRQRTWFRHQQPQPDTVITSL